MSSITKLTLAISLLGIITLLIIANTQKPELRTIKDITIKDLNKKVSTLGTIAQINNYENFQVIRISHNSFSIDILSDKITDIKETQKIKVSGKIERYKNKLQIRADFISLSETLEFA